MMHWVLKCNTACSKQCNQCCEYIIWGIWYFLSPSYCKYNYLKTLKMIWMMGQNPALISKGWQFVCNYSCKGNIIFCRILRWRESGSSYRFLMHAGSFSRVSVTFVTRLLSNWSERWPLWSRASTRHRRNPRSSLVMSSHSNPATGEFTDGTPKDRATLTHCSK